MNKRVTVHLHGLPALRGLFTEDEASKFYGEIMYGKHRLVAVPHSSTCEEMECPTLYINPAQVCAVVVQDADDRIKNVDLYAFPEMSTYTEPGRPVD